MADWENLEQKIQANDGPAHRGALTPGVQADPDPGCEQARGEGASREGRGRSEDAGVRSLGLVCKLWFRVPAKPVMTGNGSVTYGDWTLPPNHTHSAVLGHAHPSDQRCLSGCLVETLGSGRAGGVRVSSALCLALHLLPGFPGSPGCRRSAHFRENEAQRGCEDGGCCVRLALVSVTRNRPDGSWPGTSPAERLPLKPHSPSFHVVTLYRVFLGSQGAGTLVSSPYCILTALLRNHLHTIKFIDLYHIR